MIIWTHWSWLICAGVLLIFEMTTPATYFLWAGISAALIGALTWALPDIGLNWQIFLFCVLTFVSIASWKWLTLTWSDSRSESGLNEGPHRYVGNVYTLSQPIQQGSGRLTIEDKNWKILGPDLPAGDRVKVIGIAQNFTLLVEALD